jgi:hypothetical protein
MEMRGPLQAPAALSLVRIGWEGGWFPEPVCTLWRREKFLTLLRIKAGRPARSLVTILTELYYGPRICNRNCTDHLASWAILETHPSRGELLGRCPVLDFATDNITSHESKPATAEGPSVTPRGDFHGNTQQMWREMRMSDKQNVKFYLYLWDSLSIREDLLSSPGLLGCDAV